VDNHLPWHVENFWVGLYFEQGLFGALAVFTLLAYALASTVRSALRGNRIALALASSMCAFIVIGFLSSFLEFPRLTTLFYVVIFVGLLPSLSERIPRTVDSRAGLGLTAQSAHPQQASSESLPHGSS
jgi:O-antigen ligase